MEIRQRAENGTSLRAVYKVGVALGKGGTGNAAGFVWYGVNGHRLSGHGTLPAIGSSCPSHRGISCGDGRMSMADVPLACKRKQNCYREGCHSSLKQRHLEFANSVMTFVVYSYLGYRNQGRRPVETINLFSSQESQDDT